MSLVCGYCVLGDMVAVFTVDEAGPSEVLITTYKTTERKSRNPKYTSAEYPIHDILTFWSSSFCRQIIS